MIDDRVKAKLKLKQQAANANASTTGHDTAASIANGSLFATGGSVSSGSHMVPPSPARNIGGAYHRTSSKRYTASKLAGATARDALMIRI